MHGGLEDMLKRGTVQIDRHQLALTGNLQEVTVGLSQDCGCHGSVELSILLSTINDFL